MEQYAGNRNVGVVQSVGTVEAMPILGDFEFVPAGMRSARSSAQAHLRSDEGLFA